MIVLSGEKLKAQRVSKGWSVQTLVVEISLKAREWGLDLAPAPALIYQWENEETATTQPYLWILADIFGLDMGPFGQALLEWRVSA